MIFLNPAILFGLLAASIPVILHFLNLKKIKKVEFSTLTFLKELQKTKIKKIKFKQWLLLLLRILIILFIVSSFARPTLESVAISGTGSVAKTTAIFILDDSYSMSVVNDNGSYINQAKQIIIDLVSDFNEGDDVILLLTSSPEKSIFLNNKNLNDKNIRNIDISYISKSLTESILLASEMIRSSQTYNKEVYILSDFQESTILKSKNEYEISPLPFDESTKLYLFRFEGKSVKNLAVNKLIVNNQILEIKKEISLTANVTNSSDDQISGALLSIFINGEVNAHQNFSANSGTTELLNYKTTLKHSGTLELVAELEDDEIEFDNRYYTLLKVPKKINVLIVSYDLADSKYIKLALNTSPNSVFTVDELNWKRIHSTNFEKYNCVFLIGLNNNINTERLSNYVGNGGRLIIMPSSNQSYDAFFSVLNSFGISDYGVKQTISDINQYNSFEDVNYEHPLFQNLFEEKEKNPKFESPKINSYFKTSRNGRGENIITLLDGSSFLSEYKYKTGRIFLFNVAPDLSWSDFPLKSIFAPIINRSVYYLTSNRNVGKEYLAGDIIDVNVSNIKLPQVKIIRPDNGEEFIYLDSISNNTFLKYKNSNLIGIYKFYSGDELIDAVAVNVNYSESNLTPFSQNDFESFLNDNSFKGTILNMDNSNYKNEIAKARYGSELWQIFLIISLILALIEMFVAKNAKKDLANLTI